MDGIINIYKESGFTSFDVVAILRKKFKTKKVGHTGTLDPEAQGVLPVCLGKATRLADYLTEKVKVYEAVMRLGIETDTQDQTGTILNQLPVTCDEAAIRASIVSFIGPYAQIPPMYSAIKINGQKLYDLARAGQVVEREPRHITIHDIDSIVIEGDTVSMTVTCSKGTYIRTLCHDIGNQLGCGAHMCGLVRSRSGNFDLSTALKLDQLDGLIDSGKINDYIIPIDSIFTDYLAVTVDMNYDKWLLNGNKLKQSYLLGNHDILRGQSYRVYDHQNRFIGLYECVEVDDGPGLKPITLFL